MESGRSSAHGRRRGRGTLVLAVWLVASMGCEVVTTDTIDPFDRGAPVADFDESQSRGAPGLVVQFTSTSTGNISSHAWDFGALGTSSEENPVVTYPAEGTYTVTLTVSGPSGTSTIEKTDLVQVGAMVVGGFTCTPLIGYSPLTVDCTDESQNADTWLWDFGDGATSTTQNPSHVYTGTNTFTLQQTASGPAGSVTGSVGVQVGELRIISNTPSGAPAPVTVDFTADTGGIPANSYRWVIDGAIVGSTQDLTHTFLSPGTYSVRIQAAELVSGGALGQTEITFTVGYGQAIADFAPDVTGGNGPLTVNFQDLSGGQIDKWDWTFEPGAQCVFPAQPDDPAYDMIPVCSSASPTWVYAGVGSYDVSLTVTGPGATAGAPDVVSSVTMVDAVRVYIDDPSFELQTPGTEIAGAWQSVRPAGLTQDDIHLALAGPEIGMPTDGSQWAMIDAIETDGLTPVAQLENGIRQQFLLPPDRTVLELDYALLFNEPPIAGSADGVTATVSDGTTTVEIPSAIAEASAPYAGQSTVFPDRDGSVVRITPIRTASLDVAQAFPTAPDLTLFTLTVRVGNRGDGFRSPRAYVDAVRFTAASSQAVTADFTLPAGLIAAGEPVAFSDVSCVGPVVPSCPSPSSWRWDFGTSQLTTPPAASGSDLQDPTYTFPTAGSYTVQLTSRFADREDTVSTVVDVIDPLVPAFVISDPPGPTYTAPVDLTFADTSTSDASDPIVGWSWDFGGFGTPSTLQAPPPVSFTQAGDYEVTLTITTQSGLMATVKMPVTID